MVPYSSPTTASASSTASPTPPDPADRQGRPQTTIHSNRVVCSRPECAALLCLQVRCHSEPAVGGRRISTHDGNFEHSKRSVPKRNSSKKKHFACRAPVRRIASLDF